MRLLVSWVRDFVDVSASPEAIAETLGLRGFEVAAIEPLAGGDGVIDFEVTANRPDCLSVLGFAREIATCYSLPLRLPTAKSDAKVALAPITAGESERLAVTIEDSDLCPRYVAAVAEVTPTVSPAWMQARLLAAGVRPISPFVDITNYVLMELGHPMHAFDLARLAGSELRVRRAKAGETLSTLDGVDRTLDEEMLIIADARKPQALAGVMGGAASEVSGTTRTIAFESAYFKPASIRRTSKRLGLKTEASSRFERGTDINAPLTATARAIALMHQIGAGRVIGPAIDRYPTPRGPKSLKLRRAQLIRVLGLSIPDGDVERILKALGLSVGSTADGWNIEAPTFRVDLLREVDLIEEVGRHYGFDRLESAFPVIATAAAAPDPRVRRDGLVRFALTAAGLSEAMSFGFIEAKAAKAFTPGDSGDGGDTIVEVANPLSGKFDTLRPSLLPGLVDGVAHNRRHRRRDVALFEIGARFSRHDGETRGVGVAWTGAFEHWSAPARDVDFFDVKGVVEQLAAVLGIQATFAPVQASFLVAGQSAAILAGDSPIGLAGLVSPGVAEGRGAPRHDKIFVAELNLDRIWELLPDAVRRGDAATAVKPLPRYPHVVRDLSIVVADGLPAEIIRGTIQRAGAHLAAPLVETTFFDRYQGKGLQDGTVSLSVRLTFQAIDRTLTDPEVQNSFDTILAALIAEHQAIQR